MLGPYTTEIHNITGATANETNTESEAAMESGTEPEAVDVELSRDQIEGLCALINNPIKRNDIRARNIANAQYMTCHRPTVPPSAPFDIRRQNLPVFAFRQKILNTISNEKVVLISGTTGCGKSTQVPQYIIEDCQQKGLPCKILCTQPRRLAVTSIAKRVANERRESLPGTIGYHIRLKNCTKPDSALIFMTR